MKITVKILVSVILVLVLRSSFVLGQKIDEQKMERDIEVAENVLSTLLRQQFDKQRMFFPLEVTSNYQPGYGVTFRFPADYTTPIMFSLDGMQDFGWQYEGDPDTIEPVESIELPATAPGAPKPPKPPKPLKKSPRVYSYSYSIESDDDDDQVKRHEKSKAEHRKEGEEGHREIVIKSKGKSKYHDVFTAKKSTNLDSVRDVYSAKMIKACKDFLADYSDLIGQLSPTEKIIITNQGDQPRRWVNKLVNSPNRTHLTVEVLRSDVSLYKQGKINRDQLMKKITVVNTEAVESVEPDLELLSSIFNRLYQIDLAKTFFIEDDVYYERLKDYGAVFYMHVYSSNQNDALFSMPTVKLRDMDQQTRDKKVVELYPEFEKELKENILEYGRTVKSLKDDETLVFNVKLTKCVKCDIPSTLEIIVKGSVLKDYGSGKSDKSGALSKITLKKGPNQ